MKTWFENYTKSFEQTDGIILKTEHSLKVAEESVFLAQKLGWNSWDVYLAEVIGLLHDIGRFEQYTKYKTFKDKDSVNHAKLGVKILKKLKVLRHYDKQDQFHILRAIRNHNKPFLVGNFTYAYLLRDADKLDIYRVFTDYMKGYSPIEFKFKDTPGISKYVYKSIMNHKFIRTNKVQNLNDFKCFCIAWLFDVYYKNTFKEIINRGYINFLFDSMNSNTQIDDCRKTIEKLIQKKLLF